MPHPHSYPIGTFSYEHPYSAAELQEKIGSIASFPVRFREAVAGLSEAQLNTPYREGGWAVRQLIHHVADSHSQGYMRVKLALTEDNPTIKPYEEQLWAELNDSFAVPVEASLNILDAVHARWVAIYAKMQADDWNRTFFHPGLQTKFTLKQHVGLYTWHGNHHLAHVTHLKERMGWQ